jgi:2-methylcitrate dehydratase (2-methyl-trans-aconitate forming)
MKANTRLIYQGMKMSNSEKCMATLDVNGKEYAIYDAVAACNLKEEGAHEKLPYSLRILAENIVRTEGDAVLRDSALAALISRSKDVDLPYRPSRVVLQDLLGTPALVDLAGLRDAVAEHGGDPLQVNPVTPVHLVVDHSLNVEHWGSSSAMTENMNIERNRNAERFSFLAWANKAFHNVSIIPSGTGILHQINIERLTPVIATRQMDDMTIAYPDTLVGTDSHTTMINAIGVLGWGVGGIEAEAAMLGKALMLRLPEIVGVRLEGDLPQGYVATDIALALSETLRATGVIGAYIEFFGPSIAQLSLADRGTISNMAPEFGATAAIFPIDERTIDYMLMTGRSPSACALTRAYAKSQGLWSDMFADVIYDRTITVDLAGIKRAIAGPKQPHQRIVLGLKKNSSLPVEAATSFLENETSYLVSGEIPESAVVIAAITSCTNTSNPRAVLAAGLLARKALSRGLKRAPWTKTSFAPGSLVVGEYLSDAGLDKDLDALGFNIIGYGCTTCNGMSGPLLSPELENLIRKENIATVAVTSGNRNFEGRIHPLAREAFIMSPPLVVAYAIAGKGNIDPEIDPIGYDFAGAPVFLNELWPSDQELDELEQKVVTAKLFDSAYADVPAELSLRSAEPSDTDLARYEWNDSSTYIRRPPYWSAACRATNPLSDLSGMRMLAMLGDHITTDHISPSGAILAESDAGQYLLARGVPIAEFNSYGTRRGNHEAAMRATFASPRLQNELLPGKEGPFTRLLPDNSTLSIFEAAQEYATRSQPLLVIAGQNYGSGSSRDWAAKGPRLLGVRVVLAESFERIHRSNLAGMGILPLQFSNGATRKTLALTGDEIIDIEGVDAELKPNQILNAVIHRASGETIRISVLCRLDTHEEIQYFAQGGLLPQLLNQYLAQK